MNVNKTNKLGVFIANHGFNGDSSKSINILKDKTSDQVTVNKNLLKHNKNQKIFRVTKNIMNACRLIDIDSIINNVDIIDFNFTSMFILLDSDKSGFIKIEKYGSDFHFTYLEGFDNVDRGISFYYNIYSFVSKSFSITENNSFSEDNYSKSIFVVQLITYLFYGDVNANYISPKQSKRIGYSKILNNSKTGITFCDTLWKQRLKSDGFKVSGHFRLQPFGEKRLKRKLIWIEQFEKNGYNRKATMEYLK